MAQYDEIVKHLMDQFSEEVRWDFLLAIEVNKIYWQIVW